MKIYEILKKENIGKIFETEDGEKFSVNEYSSKFENSVVLIQEDTPVYITSKILDLNFKEVKSTLNWFNKESQQKRYYYIDSDGEIESFVYDNVDIDERHIKFLNSFTSKEKAEYVRQRQLLDRMVMKFRDENDEDVNEIPLGKKMWEIRYSLSNNEFYPFGMAYSRSMNGVYFTTSDMAQRCINEVVKPFFGGDSFENTGN